MNPHNLGLYVSLAASTVALINHSVTLAGRITAAIRNNRSFGK